jgi:hypothetical protein
LDNAQFVVGDEQAGWHAGLAQKPLQPLVRRRLPAFQRAARLGLYARRLEEKVILAALHDFSKLDFATIQGIVGGEIAVVGKALARLMDFHVIEAAGDDTYQAAPPLRIAIDRDKRLALRPDQRRAMLKVVSDSLQAYADDNEISVSMIDAGILATLQEGNDVSPLFSAFLLPSHLVWLAKRHYDRRRRRRA